MQFSHCAQYCTVYPDLKATDNRGLAKSFRCQWFKFASYHFSERRHHVSTVPRDEMFHCLGVFLQEI